MSAGTFDFPSLCFCGRFFLASKSSSTCMHTAVDIDGVQQENPRGRDRNYSLLAEDIAAAVSAASDVTGGKQSAIGQSDRSRRRLPQLRQPHADDRSTPPPTD